MKNNFLGFYFYTLINYHLLPGNMAGSLQGDKKLQIPRTPCVILYIWTPYTDLT